jgi:hypothetical protein
VISREFTSGNTTTIYEAGGRNVGRVTPDQFLLWPPGLLFIRASESKNS